MIKRLFNRMKSRIQRNQQMHQKMFLIVTITILKKINRKNNKQLLKLSHHQKICIMLKSQIIKLLSVKHQITLKQIIRLILKISMLHKLQKKSEEKENVKFYRNDVLRKPYNKNVNKINSQKRIQFKKLLMKCMLSKPNITQAKVHWIQKMKVIKIRHLIVQRNNQIAATLTIKKPKITHLYLTTKKLTQIRHQMYIKLMKKKLNLKMMKIQYHQIIIILMMMRKQKMPNITNQMITDNKTKVTLKTI